MYSKAENDGDRIVTIMHNSGLTSQQICRQVSLNAKVQTSGEPTTWGEELLSSGMGISVELTEEDRLAAALVAAHFSQGRNVGLQDINNINKVSPDINEVVASSNSLESQMRLFTQSQQLVVDMPLLPTLGTLPALPSLKRAQEHVWFQSKQDEFDKDTFKGVSISLKNETNIKSIPLENCDADMLLQNKSNKKSLPHKKRISRRLKRSTPLPASAGAATTAAATSAAAHSCRCEHRDEGISTDNFVEVQSVQENILTQQIRPSFICLICGDFYDVDQLKFYQHLKQHYEPQSRNIMIENVMNQTHSSSNGLGLDKMDDTCTIVDNGTPLSLVELSLEGTVSGKPVLHQPCVKENMYSSSDNTKEMYDIAEQEALNKDELQPALYSCPRCTKTFRKQKACEAHYKEFHTKGIDEMSEFSEPEDLMEGIHVMVEPDEDYHEASDIPHLTVENGHVHQGHLIMKQWFMRNSEANSTHTLSPQSPAHQIEIPISNLEEEPHLLCPLCSQVLPGREAYEQHALGCNIHLKEEMLQRTILVEEAGAGHLSANSQHQNTGKAMKDLKVSVSAAAANASAEGKKTRLGHKKFVCSVRECAREFRYRNSLLYHALSHSGHRPFSCHHCDKSFYTTGALKVHSRLHSGDKPYKCEECGRDFRQWGDLKYHKASLHSTQKLHQCEYCGKDFARKYSLNVHRRIHTGEKNYKCDFCSKSFRASSYLLFHRRIHTGEKPHDCDQCDKSFRVKGDLRRHILTHSKTKLIGDNPKKRVAKKVKSIKEANEQIEQKKSKINIVMKSCTSSEQRSELLLVTKEQAYEESDDNYEEIRRKPIQDFAKVTKKETEDQTSSPEDTPVVYSWPYGT